MNQPGDKAIVIPLPDGWELDCDTSDFRLQLSESKDRAWYPAISVRIRPVWQWPPWLKAKWIAMDGQGKWHGFGDQPAIQEAQKTWWGFPSFEIVSTMIDFTPPPCADWKTSKRRNPNA